MAELKNTCPGLDEIIEAAKPETGPDERMIMTKRLSACTEKSEPVLGAWLFLLDNHYDYDLLYRFLNSKSDIKQRQITNNLTYIKRVAAVLVMIFTTAAIVHYLNQVNFTNTIHALVIVDKGLPVFAGGEKDVLLNEFMNHYKTNEYEVAFSYIEKLRSIDYTTDTISYYAALMHFKRKEYTLSLYECNVVIGNRESIFYQKAQYLKSLNLLLTGKKEEAFLLLTALTNAADNELAAMAKAAVSDKSIWK